MDAPELLPDLSPAAIAARLPAKARARLGEYLRSSYRPSGVEAGHSDALLSSLGLIQRLPASPLSRKALYQITPRGEATCTQLHLLAKARVAPHHSLAGELAKWLREHQGMWTWENAKLSAPGLGWVRPDVLAVKSKLEECPQAVIYEVKRSRSDLLGDVAKPQKRAGYFALAGRVYYATAPGIATEDDIPPECGWIEQRPPLDWKVKRVAPRQHQRGLSGVALLSLAASGK